MRFSWHPIYKWTRSDSNWEPACYEHEALTDCATSPYAMCNAGKRCIVYRRYNGLNGTASHIAICYRVRLKGEMTWIILMEPVQRQETRIADCSPEHANTRLSCFLDCLFYSVDQSFLWSIYFYIVRILLFEQHEIQAGVFAPIESNLASIARAFHRSSSY